jgi:MFS family permease
MGFIALFTLSVAAVIIKPSVQAVKKPTRQLFNRSIIKDRAFTVFVLAPFFMWLGFLVPYILAPTFGLMGLDHPVPEDLAYYMLAVPNATQALGRILPATMVDQKLLSAETILLFNSVVAGTLALCWIAVHNLGGFAAFLVLYGFFSGAVTTLPAFIIPYLSPSLAVIGTRMGVMYGAAGFGALIGTPIALAIDTHGRPFLVRSCGMGLQFFSLHAFVCTLFMKQGSDDLQLRERLKPSPKLQTNNCWPRARGISIDSNVHYPL